jgi:dihydrofolate reductase
MPGRVSAEPAPFEMLVAIAENDVIGRDNALPWRLPEDLRRFKAITLGNNVLMGRKTHESIGRALPGRRNIILTHRADYRAEGCVAVRSLDEARAAAQPDRPILVIGGAEIYRLCLPFTRRIHLTIVHTVIERGDARFDGWRDARWRERGRESRPADATHAFPYSFVTLERS